VVSNVQPFQGCMLLLHVSSLTCMSRKSPSRQMHSFELTELRLFYARMLN
jgi:hypothetical protein